MTTDDHGHPESEDDLVEIRKQNSDKRRHRPDLPASVGKSERGVLSNEEPKDMGGPGSDSGESAKASGS